MSASQLQNEASPARTTTAMPNADQIGVFCWGVLFHMLGLKNECESMLGNGRLKGNDILHELARAVVDHGTLQSEIGKRVVISDPKKREAKRTNRNEMQDRLIRMVGHTGRILDWKDGGIGLGRECKRESHEEGPGTGYSRDPFREIADKVLAAESLPLAAVCYLIRSEAIFFCRPRSARNFSAAKTALNDLHQAFQLAWRLYHNLDKCHRSDPRIGLKDYRKQVRGYRCEAGSPGKSSYFVWNLFLMCDIIRGNIYKQIDYIEEANRHYRHAEGRFDAILTPDDREDSTSGKWLVTPTFIRALFERSKIRFDLGEFLESLQTQLYCLEQLVVISQSEPGDHKPPDSTNFPVHAGQKPLLDKLQQIRNFLAAERTLPAYDRELITVLFGDPDAHPSEWADLTNGVPSLDPEALAEQLAYAYAPLAAEILARIGFTLYVLCGRRLKKRTAKQEEWLLSYFRFDIIWEKFVNKTKDNLSYGLITASNLGRYAETLLAGVPDKDNDQKSGKDKDGPTFFKEKIERRFALLLRKMTRDNDAVVMRGEEGFYKELLIATTQNVDNLVTIPRRNHSILMRRGYRYRREKADLSETTVLEGLHTALHSTGTRKSARDNRDAQHNKLVVLRRWQSFNPKIPRPSHREVRGGGYYLLWHDKGIVIDPGYDFIQNFYDEGFSIEDIDAIIITHSHPDHDDDFASLLTLLKEWNEFHEKTGRMDLVKKWDLFLNESTHRKFSSWLQASEVKFGRIMQLSLVCWNKDSEDASEGPLRGKNTRFNLEENEVDASTVATYRMIIEVVPAWHDDVIGKTAAVGLKFHLFDHVVNEDGQQDYKEVAILGYTGDTGAYGLSVDDSVQSGKRRLRIDNQYHDCDVLIAHLGDIRLRELASVMRTRGYPWYCHSGKKPRVHPVIALLRSWFREVEGTRFTKREFTDKLREFLYFATTLDLVPSIALKVMLPCRGKGAKEKSVRDWLGHYLQNHGKRSWGIKAGWTMEKGLDWIRDHQKDAIGTTAAARRQKQTTAEILEEFEEGETQSERIPDAEAREAYRLLEFVSICTLFSWRYPYHLGIFGVYHLFESMMRNSRANSRDGSSSKRLFVIGELPEELTSYRHTIACWLNQMRESRLRKKPPVYAITGDIGLHIGLHRDGASGRIEPTIRCVYCNYNNETVCKCENYKTPDKIDELSVKRLDGSMIYLCTEKDHFPQNQRRPRHFLSRPELHVI